MEVCITTKIFLRALCYQYRRGIEWWKHLKEVNSMYNSIIHHNSGYLPLALWCAGKDIWIRFQEQSQQLKDCRNKHMHVVVPKCENGNLFGYSIWLTWRWGCLVVLILSGREDKLFNNLASMCARLENLRLRIDDAFSLHWKRLPLRIIVVSFSSCLVSMTVASSSVTTSKK